MYEGKVIFITSDLLERRVKIADIIRNEFLLQRRINNEHIWSISYSDIRYSYDNND